MITIFPMENIEERKTACDRMGVQAEVVLEAKDREEVLGWIAFSRKGDGLCIQAIDPKEAFIVDGLIKSAISYADQRRITRIETAPALKCEESFLLAIGFKKTDDGYHLDINHLTNLCGH